MKTLTHLLLLLLLLPAGMVFAQSPPPPDDPFLIGAYAVAPEWNSNGKRIEWVKGTRPPPLLGGDEFLFLTQTQFDRARELGLNIIHTTVDPVDVRIPAPNVVRQICDYAAPPSQPEPLRVNVLDQDLQSTMKGERIILHPEALDCFQQRGSYLQQTVAEFQNLPLTDSKLATPLIMEGANHNCVRMEKNRGIIESVTDSMKKQLSMFRFSWDPTEQHKNRASGLYVLSVIVRLEDPGTLSQPPANTPIITVEVLTADSIRDQQGRCVPKACNFPLNESQFFDANNQVTTDAVEIPIGVLELCMSVDSVVYFREGTIRNHHWNDLAAAGFEKILSGTEFWNLYLNHKYLDTLDIRVSHSQSDVTVLLDAVCLSSPRTFAMFNPTHEWVQSGPLAAWQNVHDDFLGRLEDILYSDGNPNTEVRFIDGPEHGWQSGFWPMAAVAQQYVAEESENRTTLICSAGYTEPPAISSALSGRFASGYYGYPIRNSIPSPSLMSTHPGHYHHLLNQPNSRGFTDITLRYRKHSELRKRMEQKFPWIPYVQNHSNIFTTNQPRWDDDDPLREPTAAELRLQCNIALACGADGVYFYQFVSWPWRDTDPYWPPDSNSWDAAEAADPLLPTHPDVGSLGFLDEALAPREFDWNRENKWDSAVVYVNDFLRPIGEFVKEHLEWQDTKLWHVRTHPLNGVSTRVKEVQSFSLGSTNEWDPADSVFVITAEFKHRSTNESYLFMVNGRSHHVAPGRGKPGIPEAGQRHIVVKLMPDTDPSKQWKVTNVLSGDIWIVRPVANPALFNFDNAFVDFLGPGEAALYRLEACSRPQDNLPDTFPGNLYVTPGASMSLGSSNIHYLRPGQGVYVDGHLYANGSRFLQETEGWLGVHARSDATVVLNNCVLDGGPAVSGSLATLNLTGTRIQNVNHALLSFGGNIASSHTVAPNCRIGYASVLGPVTKLHGDSAVSIASPPSGSLGVDVRDGAGYVNLFHSDILGFSKGLRTEGTIVSSDSPNNKLEGGNRITALDTVLHSVDGWIEFGRSMGGYGANNCFTLVNYTTGQHVVSPIAWTWAKGNYWSPMPVKKTGNARTDSFLLSCGAPFSGDPGARSYSKAGPIASYEAILQALHDSNYTLLRPMLSARFAAMRGNAMDMELLRLTRFAVLDHPALQDFRDTLLLHLLAHPSLESKIEAADVLSDVRRFAEALQILESYSFVGSPLLRHRRMLRGALLLPHVRAGGFDEACRILDTIRTSGLCDAALLTLIDRYPALYCTVLPDTQGTHVPKSSRLSSLLDAILPHDIAIEQNYPNPFSDVTSFTFRLGREMNVRLAVYDAMGRERAVLVDGPRHRGVHSVPFRSGTLPSGLYFYRIDSDAGTIQRKMILAR